MLVRVVPKRPWNKEMNIKIVKVIKTWAIILLCIGCLTGCNNGEGTEDSHEELHQNIVPIASTGSNQNVATGSLVTLDGSRSTDANGDILSYSWKFISKPSNSLATLSDSDVVRPTFNPDVDGTYILCLIVNDGQDDSEVSTVTITAATLNSAPVANAGLDQNVTTGSLVTLDGGSSTDANGDILNYDWSFISLPSGSLAILSDSALIRPTFEADISGTYVIGLIVNDGKDDSEVATVTIIAANLNSAPVANAGLDQNVTTGSLVTLDGGSSTDANGDILSYSWTFIAMPTNSMAILSDSSVVSPSFDVDIDGNYVLRLIVNDGQEDSEPSTVTITAVTQGGGADLSPPSLLSMTFPETIDLSGGNSPILISATAEDSDSGVKSIWVSFDKTLRFTTGQNNWIQANKTITLLSTNARDTYNVTGVKVEDNEGNSKTYLPIELEELGISTSFVLTGALADSEPPVLLSMTFPETIDLSGGNTPMLISATAEDSDSGVKSIWVSFDKTLRFTTGQNNWIQANKTITLLSTNARDTYNVTGVKVEDNEGNSKTYLPIELEELGISTYLRLL
jgi:hypothetical protein